MYKIYNKYQNAKVKNLEWSLDSQKHNIKKKQQNHKNYKKYIYEVSFKNRVLLQDNCRL